jgi:hypothetical protein
MDESQKLSGSRNLDQLNNNNQNSGDVIKEREKTTFDYNENNENI